MNRDLFFTFRPLSKEEKAIEFNRLIDFNNQKFDIFVFYENREGEYTIEGKKYSYIPEILNLSTEEGFNDKSRRQFNLVKNPSKLSFEVYNDKNQYDILDEDNYSFKAGTQILIVFVDGQKRLELLKDFVDYSITDDADYVDYSVPTNDDVSLFFVGGEFFEGIKSNKFYVDKSTITERTINKSPKISIECRDAISNLVDTEFVFKTSKTDTQFNTITNLFSKILSISRVPYLTQSFSLLNQIKDRVERIRVANNLTVVRLFQYFDEKKDTGFKLLQGVFELLYISGKDIFLDFISEGTERFEIIERGDNETIPLLKLNSIGSYKSFHNQENKRIKSVSVTNSKAEYSDQRFTEIVITVGAGDVDIPQLYRFDEVRGDLTFDVVNTNIITRRITNIEGSGSVIMQRLSDSSPPAITMYSGGAFFKQPNSIDLVIENNLFGEDNLRQFALAVLNNATKRKYTIEKIVLPFIFPYFVFYSKIQIDLSSEGLGIIHAIIKKISYKAQSLEKKQTIIDVDVIT